jgi:hypothetical protein
MPLHWSYLKAGMMHAEIRLDNPASYVRLLHAFEAIHNGFSHDHDVITFFNDDDGMSLRIDSSVSYVSFGPASADEDARRWTENIGFTEILSLLLHFMQRDYARLEGYRWMSDEAAEERSDDSEADVSDGA